MNRRAAGALVAAALLILLFALWRLTRSEPRRVPAPGAAQPAAEASSAIPELERRTATLWLPGARGRISPLAVELESAPNPKARLAVLLDTLLATGAAQGATALFPEPVEVATLLLGPDGTLYVDLRSPGGGPPPAAGSTLEAQRVYSIVHTVLHNEPEVRGVVLLWNGTQRPAFSGHIDTSRALTLLPEMELEVE